MNLKININERRAQTPPRQKSTCHMISQNSRKGKLIYSDSKSAVAWGWGWAEGKITMGQEKTFGNIFITMTVMMASQVYSQIKIYLIVHFKCAQFIVCQLYLNRVVKQLWRQMTDATGPRKRRRGGRQREGTLLCWRLGIRCPSWAQPSLGWKVRQKVPSPLMKMK